MRRHRHDGCIRKQCVAQQSAQLVGHRAHARVIHEVGLVERDHATRNAEERDDIEVLDRLRHDAVVSGHDQQHEIDAGRPGHHVAHEALVAGHVYDADLADARKLEVREAEINGHAAALFLGQAVGVDAGQALHERGLAVVDVPGGADDHGFVPASAAIGIECRVRPTHQSILRCAGRTLQFLL